MELVSNNGSFKDAITNLSTTIAQIYPVTGQKGHKSLILEIGTSENDFKTYVNGMEFTYKNQTECFCNEDYSNIPLQLRKLIQVGKQYRETSTSNNSKLKASEITQHKQEQQDLRVTLSLRKEIQGLAKNPQEKSTAIVEYTGDKVISAGSFGGKRLKKKDRL